MFTDKAKKVIGCSIFAGLLATPVFAFLPVPAPALPVVDSAHIIETVFNGKTLTAQLAALGTIYGRVSQQYSQALYMAQYLKHLPNYRVTMTSWQGTFATNGSGTTPGWLAAVNSGLNVSGGFLNSTYGRPPYAAIAAVIPAIQQARAKMHYGTLELRDGTSQTAMQTIGALRLHGSQSEAALIALENDSESSAPDDNTTAALLNKINAANMINARMAADTNKALVTQAEMQLIENKERHDAEAAMVENQVAFQTIGMPALRAQHANMSSVMQSFIMP